VVWTKVATIWSESEPGKTYDIKRRADGVYGCGCTAYRFAKGEKTCKHLRAYLAGEAMDAMRAVKPTVGQESVRVSSAGETFRVKRAIAFSKF